MSNRIQQDSDITTKTGADTIEAAGDKAKGNKTQPTCTGVTVLIGHNVPFENVSDGLGSYAGGFD